MIINKITYDLRASPGNYAIPIAEMSRDNHIEDGLKVMENDLNRLQYVKQLGDMVILIERTHPESHPAYNKKHEENSHPGKSVALGI